MTSNRPANENQLDLICTEEAGASTASELPTEESVSAAVEKSALSMTSENLMERIVDQANLETAWQNVRANPEPPAPMASPWTSSRKPFGRNGRRSGGNSWKGLTNRVRPGVSRFPNRMAARNLGIPNVIDRLLQQAILQVLTPIFDPGFSESSFGFRPGRSAQEQPSRYKPTFGRLSAMRRYGFVEILRPRPTRRADGAGVPEGRRQTVADADRAVLAGGRHGRHRTAALDRRHDARRSAFAVAGEHPAGRFRQRVGIARPPLCALCG